MKHLKTGDFLLNKRKETEPNLDDSKGNGIVVSGFPRRGVQLRDNINGF